MGFRIIVFLLLLALDATAANDKEQANSYDDLWEEKWVTRAQNLYRVAGKTPGFVIHVGDYTAFYHGYGKWSRFGDGKTAEDNRIFAWIQGSDWNATRTNDGSIKNGFYLATTSTSLRRGMTAGAGIETAELICGAGNQSTPMPVATDALVAKRIVEDGVTYPLNLQIDTIAAAFSDAQFAILSVGMHDALEKRDTAQFIGNVKQIIATLESQNIVVILSTIPPHPDFKNAESTKLVESYNAGIRELAANDGHPLIDFFAEILARRPGTSWQDTLIKAGWGPSDSGNGYTPVSSPYADGGDPRTHRTGKACENAAYLLKAWLTIQKLKEIRSRVVERQAEDADARIKSIETEREKAGNTKVADELATKVFNLYLQSNRPAKAIDYLNGVITSVNATPARVAPLLTLQIRAQVAPLQNPAEAQRQVERLIERCSSELEFVIDSLLAVGAFWEQNSNPSAAIKLYRRAIELGRARLTNEKTYSMERRLAAALVGNKNFIEAAEVYRQLISKTPGSSSRIQLQRELASAQNECKQYDAAAESLQQIILEHPHLIDVCLDSQKRVIGAHMQARSYAKALTAAVRYFYAANTAATLEDATRTVTAALKAVDGDVLRANQFLRYQKSGPSGEDGKNGTADDLENVLSAWKDIQIAPDEKEREQLKSAMARMSVSLEDRRAKGYLYLLYGQPIDAAREFRQIVEICPCTSAGIQSAINDFAVALKAVHGHVHSTETFVEYVIFGPRGKSGNANLANPFKEY